MVAKTEMMTTEREDIERTLQSFVDNMRRAWDAGDQTDRLDMMTVLACGLVESSCIAIAACGGKRLDKKTLKEVDYEVRQLLLHRLHPEYMED